MHRKNIRLIVRKQLKKEYPTYAERKDKMDISSLYIENVRVRTFQDLICLKRHCSLVGKDMHQLII